MAGQPRVLSLQILRFGAAALVVWLHATGFAIYVTAPGQGNYPLNNVGGAGVDIFFLISGAIIFLTAFGDRPMAPGAFMLRRLARILPLYWIVTLAWLPFASALDRPITASGMATTIFFWPVWGTLEPPVLGIGWTLCFEMLFYTAAAAVLWCRQLLVPLLMLFAASWIFRDLAGSDIFRFAGNPIILEFLAGAAIAAWWKPEWMSPKWTGLLFGGLGVGLLIVTAPQNILTDAWQTVAGDLSGIRVVAWGIPAAMILVSALSFEPFIDAEKWRSPIFLGDASYAIYLVHWPLLKGLASVLSALGQHPNIWLLSLVFFGIGISAGAAVHWYAERPIMSLLRRRRPQAAEAVA